MTPSRPYLIRALYQWIVDNGATPHLLVDARGEDVVVPRDYVDGGRIILNIGPMAVHGLTLGNERIEFSARFGGRPFAVSVPVSAVLAIYARESGQGMVFNDEPGPPPEDDGDGGGKPRRPTLRVVK